MRYETQTVRIGEYLGAIDWSWFEENGPESTNPERWAEAIERLKRLESDPDAFLATTDGGWPRFGFHEVLSVGMYDGWPYWRPYPSVCTLSPLGGAEWHSFQSITDLMEKSPEREAQS